jgi:hypothetical protein
MNQIPRKFSIAPTRARIDTLVNMTPGKLKLVAKRVVSWVWKMLNPLEGVEDEQEDGPNVGEDEVQRGYKAQSQRS